MTLLLAVVCYSLIYASIRSQARVRAALIEMPQSTMGNSATACDVSTENVSNVAHQSTRDGRHDIFLVSERPNDSVDVPIDDNNKNGLFDGNNADSAPQVPRKEQVCTGSGDASNIPQAIPKRSPERARVVRSRGDHKTTQMLLFTNIILLLLWLPSTVLNHVPGDVLTTFRRQSSGMNALIYTCFAMRSLNHIVNIFVYLIVNKRFREDCRALLKQLWKR